MSLNLKDLRNYKFGSVEWQEAMIHNINEKIRHNEELGLFEKNFIKIQKEHNQRLDDEQHKNSVVTK